MKSATALRNHLATLDAEELAALLRSRRVGAAGSRVGREPRDLDELAALLLEDRSVAEALSRLGNPALQLLGAAVWLASRNYGAPQSGPYWTPLEPSTRTVSADALVELLADGEEPRRAAAVRELAALRALALVVPAEAGALALPAFVHRYLADALGLGRPVAQLMTDAYNAPEVHRVAAGLDLVGNRDRARAQAAVVELLADPEQVRGLVRSAPPAAAELLAGMLAGPPLLRTHCFLPLGGYHYGPGTKYQLRPGGSGDPGTDWLAAHGLVVPVGPDLVELPFEVADALADGRVRAPFDPEPPRLSGTEPVPDVLREAQAAAAATSRRVELLLAACSAVPAAVRKAGGLAVRDTRRLAKAVGATEEQTRLWIDLGFHADLLGVREPELERPAGRGRRAPVASGPALLLPTTRYDRWQTRSPADRLVPVICAWAVVPEVLSWWPEYREGTPVALVQPQEPEAVRLRRLVLAALATLPPGRGLGPAAALRGQALVDLVELVGWLCPSVLGSDGFDEPDGVDAGRVLATLREAELLGVVAHGRLTPLGEAVSALLDSDAADCFPYVPGADDRDAPGGRGRGSGQGSGQGPGKGSGQGPGKGSGRGSGQGGGPDYREPLAALRAALAELLPPPRTTARFQADLTAVAAGAPSAELAELLGAAADRESEGHAVVWRFGAASVRRALDAGMSAQDLLARLGEVAEGGLPQPLEYLVRDTGRTHGHIRVVRSACCIRSDDEALVLELSRTRALAKLELRRIAPTVLISTASPTATLQGLRSAGFAPVLEAETGVTVVERGPELRAEPRMAGYYRLRTRNRRADDGADDLAERLVQPD